MLRNRCMESATAAAKGADVTDPTPRPLSEQTVWLLQVRDNRSRAAFAQLFDFYAPRLKGMLMRAGMRLSLIHI